MEINDNIKDFIEVLDRLKVDPTLLKWIEAQLFLKFADSDYFEYMDNIRFAAKSNQAVCDDYMLKKQKGCCGFKDIVLKHPSGEKYMIGFNFGH